jgi:hypothetical protein
MRLKESPALPVPRSRRSATSCACTSRWRRQGTTSSRCTSRGPLGHLRERSRGGAASWRRRTARAVQVVDGATGAGGLGCLVIAAARAAEAGAGRRRRRARDPRYARAPRHLVLPRHARVPARGGRIGAAQALVGSALQIKPILTFGTEISPVGRVRTRKRAFERMVAYLERAARPRRDDWCVQHAQSPRRPRGSSSAAREILGSEPLFCTQVGPVLGHPPRARVCWSGASRGLGRPGGARRCSDRGRRAARARAGRSRGGRPCVSWRRPKPIWCRGSANPNEAGRRPVCRIRKLGGRPNTKRGNRLDRNRATNTGTAMWCTRSGSAAARRDRGRLQRGVASQAEAERPRRSWRTSP